MVVNARKKQTGRQPVAERAWYHKSMRGKTAEPKQKIKLTDVLVLLAVFFVLAAYFFLSRTPEGETSGTSVIGLVCFLAALALGGVGFLSSIYDIGAAPKGKRFPRVLFMLSVPLIGFGSVIMGYLIFMLPNSFQNDSQVASTVVSPSTVGAVAQDPEILQLLDQIGAEGDFANLNMRWSDDMLTECKWADAGGCYKSDGTVHELVMRRDIDRSFMKVAAAHEFLHYMWYKNDLDKDTRLTSYLIDFYGKNPSFQRRITTHYVDSGALKPSEFFSYGCTEVSDARLGTYIAAKCNEYIDTSKLPAMY